VRVVQEIHQGVRRALRAPEQSHPRGDPVAGEQLGEVEQVVLRREAGVPLGRPVLRDAERDQRLVEPLAGDAGVVPDVEVAVGVLERHRDRLVGVGRQDRQLLVGGVGWAHGS
jgi:hypothetical protein